jgi:histone deacetylase complex regulatory component SIN3
MPNEQQVGTPTSADAENKGEVTLEQALANIVKLEANYHDAVSERDKTKQKLRKLEETATSAVEIKAQYDAIFAEKSKLAEAFELASTELSGLKAKITDQTINTALETAITAAGAKSVSTVLKLIDRSKIQLDESGNTVADNIAAAVKAVSESDPILFGEVGTAKVNPVFTNPGVARAGTPEGTETSYAKEMKAAKNQKEIGAVMRKYGIAS